RDSIRSSHRRRSAAPPCTSARSVGKNPTASQRPIAAETVACSSPSSVMRFRHSAAKYVAATVEPAAYLTATWNPGPLNRPTSRSALPRIDRNSTGYANASSRLVFPCPFGPISATPDSGRSSVASARLRKLRITNSIARIGSTTVEYRWALVEKRARAFGLVLAGAGVPEIRGLERQGVVHGQVERAVDGLQAEAPRDRPLGEHDTQQRAGLVEQRCRRDDAIHQSDSCRFLRVDHVAREQQLERPPAAHQPGQAHGPAKSRDQSELHLG